MVSVHAERTFERLRYLLGGDRPSQTARLTMSPDLIQGHRLEFQHLKSGIPTMTPYKRRLMLHLLLRQPFEEESLRSDFIDFCIAKITACSQPYAIRI